MDTVNNNHAIDIKRQESQTNINNCDSKKVPLRIEKIIIVALAVLAGICLVAGAVVITSLFLPYAAFTAAALLAFKIATIVTGIAIATLSLVQFLNYIAPKLPRPLAVVANVIHAFITEVFSIIVMSACYFVDMQKRNPKAEEINKDQQPILLIHGLYHNSSAWIEFKNRLNVNGLQNVFTINLGNTFGSIDEHVEKVKSMVDHISQLTGRKDITLIGHSMGGLVASKFALNAEETEVTDIVTIGSPLGGTCIAKYVGIGKSVKEMRTGSDFIKDLSQKIANQTRINFFHIAATTDELVPSWSALPENSKGKKLLIPNLGHVGILYSKRVFDPIIDHIKARIKV
jgi:triacylglycerol lipase